MAKLISLAQLKSAVERLKAYIDGLITDNLTTDDATKVLSAKQGKVLRDEVGTLTDLTTTVKTDIVASINSLVTKIDAVQSGGHYELSSSDVAGALEVVADDATPNANQIKLSDANNLNKTGTDFTVGQYVLFVSDIDLTGYVKKEELSTETLTVTTTDKTIPGAINELDSDVGDKSTLTTTAKNNLVSAINEHDTEIGVLTNLTTTAKDNLVNAINELDGDIGDKSTLTTTAKGDVVSAINELDSDIGDKGNLKTTAKGDVVSAINELFDDKVAKTDIVDNLTSTDTDKPLSANQGKVLKDDLGDKASLTTTAKNNLVAAINEHDTEIGDIATLKTTEKANIVGAVNELFDDKLDKPEVDGTENQVLMIVDDNGDLKPAWTDILATDTEVDTMLTTAGV